MTNSSSTGERRCRQQRRFAGSRQRVRSRPRKASKACLSLKSSDYWYLTDHRSLEFDKKARPNILLFPRRVPRISSYRRMPRLRRLPRVHGTDPHICRCEVHVRIAGGRLAGVGARAAESVSSSGNTTGWGSASSTSTRRGARFPAWKWSAPGACSGGSKHQGQRGDRAHPQSMRDFHARLAAGIARNKSGHHDEDIARILGSALCLEGQDINVPGHLTVGDGTRRGEPYRPGDILSCDFGTLR